MSLQRLQSMARLLTIIGAAAAAGVVLVVAVANGQYSLAASVLAALLVRLQAPSDRLRHVGAIGLVLAVAAVVGVTGGPSSPLMFGLLLVMADYGLNRATRWVLLTGLAASVFTAVMPIAFSGGESLTMASLWSAVLVPLVGLVAGRVGGSQSLEGTAALESATAALDEVLRLAERMPAGFDRWSVAMAVHQELREASRLDGAPTQPHLLLVVHGVLFGVGAPMARQAVGLLDDLPSQRRSRVWTTVTRGDLPEPLATHLHGTRWHLHRLGRDGEHGVVLVPHEISPVALDDVAEVLRPAAIALANVYRFERLEDLALSAARVRLAHDLHDGVAQALTHVRFELDLLSLGRPEIADDVSQIREVADAALLEVRRTVDELREATPLVERLRRHVDLLASFAGLTIQLDVDEDIELDEEVAEGVFRIAQEALSNAVRHADADTILVSLSGDGVTVSLDVVDDGAGIEHVTRRGVGLEGMRSRARRLGGDLVVRPRRGGGTVVQLEAPAGTSGAEAHALVPPDAKLRTN